MKKQMIAALLIWLLGLTGYGFGDEVKAVKTDILSKSTQSWNGKDLPAYPAGTPEITILKITIPPGVTLPMHTHPAINAGVLLKGKLTVYTEAGSILHLKEGEALVEVVDTWHYGKNEGKTPAEIIVFYAGVKNGSITVKK